MTITYIYMYIYIYIYIHDTLQYNNQIPDSKHAGLH